MRHSPKYEILAATISWTLGRAAPWMFCTPQVLRNTRSKTDQARGDEIAHTNPYHGSIPMLVPVLDDADIDDAFRCVRDGTAANILQDAPLGPARRSGERRACRAIPSVPAFSPSITARETADKRPLIIASIIAHQKHPVLVSFPAWHEEGDPEAAPEDPHKDKGALCSASWDNRGRRGASRSP
ncbi:hypothetical protein OH76DRAFT_1033127 [Lentinus brumalis]|uniref:Uncharacterized protein n=1 Tax=Lentinus brumalis TaxID=2498619 RepID=A0A371CXI2_9APHY|nr:hypothetical protein OH76DRAFT_1033127 [Polyporus brumalis]